MRRQHLLGRPGEEASGSGPCRLPVGEGEAELPRHRGFQSEHQVPFGDERAPAAEPARRKLLQKVGEQHRAALGMKEDDLGRDRIARHDDMGDLARPRQGRVVRDLGIEDEIPALLLQAGRGIETGLGIGLLPARDEQVVQRVGCDEMADGAERGDLRLEFVAQRRWRPDEQLSASEADHGHARRVVEPERCGHLRTARDPDLGTEFFQHRHHDRSTSSGLREIPAGRRHSYDGSS